MGKEKTESKYPRAVYFIAGFELCQRFGFYVMRTVLSIFLVHWLRLEESIATVVYHLFTFLQFFSPVFGGIIADNWLGNFKAILVGSAFYGIGTIVVFVSSIPGIIVASVLTLVGLLLTGTGKGMIAPCVNVFGGDQFVLSEQNAEPQKFFSVMYVATNVANFVAIIISPILRATDCLGNDSCYPLSFGISAFFILLSSVIFVAGKTFYTMSAPKGDIVVQVSKCVVHAVKMKLKSGRKNKKKHWLDYAEEKFDAQLIADTKPSSFQLSGEITESGFIEIDPDEYQVEIENISIGKTAFGGGGVHSLVINQEAKMFNVDKITSENTVNVFRQVPQYFMMALGEMLFSITGLGFAFTQAPKSMKTVIMAGWLISVAVGNIIVIAFAGSQIFTTMLWEYLLFAGLMFLSMVVFAVQAARYTYVETPREDEGKESCEENSG